MSVWVNGIGLLLIALIVWWFWLSKPKIRRAQTPEIDILVDNGVYTPAAIEVGVNQTVVLNFLRSDPSPCAQQVVFAALDKSYELPLNEKVAVTLKFNQPGEVEFTCQMGMYRGYVRVV